MEYFKANQTGSRYSTLFLQINSLYTEKKAAGLLALNGGG